MADRYTYIPLIGIFVVVAWSLSCLASKACEVAGEQSASSPLPSPPKEEREEALPLAADISVTRAPGSPRLAPMLCVACGLAVVAACAATTRNQVGYWHSTFRLFEHALAATKKNPMAHYCLGQDYVQQGKYELAENQYWAARHEAPLATEPYIGLGTLYYQNGKLPEALEQFQAAVRVGPFHALAHNYLGVTYERMARNKEALEEFTKAVALAPLFTAGRSNLGAALAREGRLEEAAVQFHAALECDPGCAPAHFGLANTLSNQGKRDEAVAEYQAAIRLNPTNSAALNDLAWIRAAAPDGRLRNAAEAVKLAEQACKLTQFREPQLIGTLAPAYAQAGRFEDAVKTGEKAKAMAMAAGKSALATRNEELLALYRARKAYHEPK